MTENILAGLKTDSSIEEGNDSIGGFSILDSNIHKLKVKLAYVTFSAGKAMALNLQLDVLGIPEPGGGLTPAASKDIRQQFWMTSGEAKGCKNYYEKDGVKHYLPGFNQANALCLLTVGKEIAAMTTTQKTINLYDPAAKKEVPTEVSVFMDLIGVEILAGVLKQIEDKSTKDANTGKYVPTGETRETNEIDKLFRLKDGLTVIEIKGGATKPVFLGKWTDKWKGEVRNKAKGAATGGVAQRSVGAQAGTTSLFA